MFEMVHCVADPNFHRSHVVVQIVNVPMLSLVTSQMTGNARSHAAGSEGAADVSIVSRLQVELPPAAYLDVSG